MKRAPQFAPRSARTVSVRNSDGKRQSGEHFVGIDDHGGAQIQIIRCISNLKYG
jgi:hypothetical protein